MRRLGRAPFRLPRSFGRFRFPVSPIRGRKRISGRSLAVALVCLAAFAGLIAVLEHRAGPQIRALAETAAKRQASAAITAAIEDVLIEERVNYERLVGFSADENGIRSIRTNALEVNLIRAKINAAVEKAVSLRHGRLRLPIGALLGSELFAGMGPNIVVPLAMTGSALSDIRSDLSSSGVNQTMHRILMDLTVEISVILPGGAQTSEINMTVCLAETVIVGNVPNGIITQK